MLILPQLVHDQMVAHCLTGLPDEACGLLGGDPTRRMRRSPAIRRATWRPRPSSTRSTPRTICGPIVTPRRPATRSSGSSTPTPTPRPTRRPPTWPRLRIPPGTTSWSPSGTSTRWCAAIGSWTVASPRNQSHCCPGRIPTELVSSCRVGPSPDPGAGAVEAGRGVSDADALATFDGRDPGRRPCPSKSTCRPCCAHHAGGAKTVNGRRVDGR